MQHKLVAIQDPTVLEEVLLCLWHIYLFLLSVLKTEKKMNMRYNDEIYCNAKVGTPYV